MAKNAQEFMEAVKSGDPVAQYKLGMMYLNGTNGLKQDYVQAFRWFSKSAGKGNSSSMFQLGKLYENGLGVEADIDTAGSWYKAAVEGGSEEAVAYLPKRTKSAVEGGNEEAVAYFPKYTQSNTNVSDNAKDEKTNRLIKNLSRVVLVIITASLIVLCLLFLSLRFAGSHSYGQVAYDQVAIPLFIVAVIAIALPLWILHQFFRALAEITRLLLDIKNILQNDNHH